MQRSPRVYCLNRTRKRVKNGKSGDRQPTASSKPAIHGIGSSARRVCAAAWHRIPLAPLARLAGNILAAVARWGQTAGQPDSAHRSLHFERVTFVSLHRHVRSPTLRHARLLSSLRPMNFVCRR
jgi:hypothetical protein